MAFKIHPLKLFLIFSPIALIGYWVVTYFTYYDKPESFRSAIDILQQRTDIKSKIGDYQSYSYYDKDLPDTNDNPAKFKLSMTGSDAIIYLSCEVQKKAAGKWVFTKIKQDSLVRM